MMVGRVLQDWQQHPTDCPGRWAQMVREAITQYLDRIDPGSVRCNRRPSEQATSCQKSEIETEEVSQ